MELQALVAGALAEDVGSGDVTTEACVPADQHACARIFAKQDLVLSGQDAAAETFGQLGGTYQPTVKDGTLLAPGGEVARISGPARALLTAERTALNFLMHLSGIATHTASVIAASGGMKVVDTRKTTPLLRTLEKAAVVHGGGSNHRMALYDAILIKDNHIAAAGGLTQAVEQARIRGEGLQVQVEVETLQQLEAAVQAEADAVLLDNMDDSTLLQAVAMASGKVLLEASGNMDAERISGLAGSGLDRISMGGLIHQARWVDLSMRFVD